MKSKPGRSACRSVISIKLQSNFIEITPRHECSLVYLLHIFRLFFSRNTFRGLRLPLQLQNSRTRHKTITTANVQSHRKQQFMKLHSLHLKTFTPFIYSSLLTFICFMGKQEVITVAVLTPES